jgi:hypothetical protein
MQAIYTPPNGTPEPVDIAAFAERSVRHAMATRLGDAAERVTLARLIDLLASRGILTGGDVLYVLGHPSGTLHIEDPSDRADALAYAVSASLRNASDSDMRRAVEQWARARRLVMHGRDGYEQWAGGRWGLHVNPLPPRSTLLVCPNGDEVRGTEVSPHAALVWALVLEARPLRDGSRCKRCRGRAEWSWWEWGYNSIRKPSWVRWCWPENPSRYVAANDYDSPWPEGTELAWARVSAVDAEERDVNWRGRVTGPCPGCEGTGLADLTDAYAQHVLDAQPRPHGNPAVYTWTKPGNPTSIEALHVIAYRLQAKGDPLGLHLAHLLAGSPEGTADAVELLLWRTEQALA